jgi:hypothetical protein
MPAIIPAIVAAETFAEVSEVLAFSTELGAVGTMVAASGAAIIAAQVTARALGLNAGPEGLKPTTPQGAQVDTVGTFAGIPVLYGSRRVGGIRVLTEAASSIVSSTFDEIALVANYTVANAGSSFVADIGVSATVPKNDGGVDVIAWVKVGSSPAAGQYSVDSAGNYTFNAADPFIGSGNPVDIDYYANIKNDQLHLIVVWGMGPINAITQVYLDDVPITDPSFNGLVYLENYTGTDTQAASAALISSLSGKWTSAHQLRGLAYSYIRLQWSAAAFPRGKPNITADIQGALVFDPRTGTNLFSNNPWLCIRDYLTNTRYGWKVPAASIDDTTVISEANYAEQRVTAPTFTGTISVVDTAADTIRFAVPPGFSRGDGIQLASSGTLPSPLAAATTYYTMQVGDPPNTPGLPQTTYQLAATAANALAGVKIDLTTSGTGTITASFQDLQRYSCDGIVDIDRPRLENMKALLSACRGFLVFSGGLYKARSEAVASPVSLTLTEDNIIGGWSIQLPQRRTQYNRMRGNFFDASNLWQSNVAIQDSTVYRTADGGALFEGALDLPFTTDIYRAQQLAMMELKQSRFGIGVSLRATVAALQLEIGDVVPVTHATPGWASQLFRVMAIELLANDEVSLGLAQYDSSVYTLDPLSFVNAPPATNLPDPGTVQPPGAPVIAENLYSTTGSAGVKSRALITWTASTDIFVRNGGYYELAVSVTRQNAWSTFSHIIGLSYELDDMDPGTYDFRLTAINSLGVRSPSLITTKQLLGLTAPPSTPTNFSVVASNGFAVARWDLSPDLDVRIGGRAIVRFSPLTTGAAWEDGILISGSVALPGFPGDTILGGSMPLKTGTYLLKFLDSSGNYSTGFASYVATEGMVTGFTTVVTITEDAAFTGSKTHVVLSGSQIQLDTSGGSIFATGSYAFAGTSGDLATVASRRFEATIKASSFNIGSNIDAILANIDDWDSIDGASVNDCNVVLMIRTTNDDPAGSPTWGPWTPFHVGDFSCRAAQFRLDFTSGNPNHNIAVTQLRVAIKTADVASLGSPTFTGTPAAATAAVDTTTTQIATTAFVTNQASSATPAMDSAGTVGTSKRYARADHVHPSDTSLMPVTPTFVSSQQGIPAANAILNVAHGLGRQPKMVRVVLRITTAQANYSVNDEIDVTSINDGVRGCYTTGCDGTNVWWLATTANVNIPDKSSGAISGVNTNGRLVFYAW